MALKFDKHIGSTVAEKFVKYNLEILRYFAIRRFIDIETRP